jgi:hypothetical protein
MEQKSAATPWCRHTPKRRRAQRHYDRHGRRRINVGVRCAAMCAVGSIIEASADTLDLKEEAKALPEE